VATSGSEPNPSSVASDGVSSDSMTSDPTARSASTSSSSQSPPRCLAIVLSRPGPDRSIGKRATLTRPSFSETPSPTTVFTDHRLHRPHAVGIRGNKAREQRTVW
jgi:hypothetical protein